MNEYRLGNATLLKRAQKVDGIMTCKLESSMASNVTDLAGVLLDSGVAGISHNGFGVQDLCSQSSKRSIEQERSSPVVNLF